MSLERIKKRIGRAIRSEFGPGDPQFQWMHSNKRQYIAGLRRLEALRNNPSRLSVAFTEHYSAFSTRVVLALCAFKKKRPSVLGRRMREIEDVARQMDTETRNISTFTKTTSEGAKTRRVHSFGKVAYARQLALSDFISCVGPSPYNDYGVPGAGNVAAHIGRIRHLVADGCNHFLAADFRQAFSSVQPTDVANLLSIPEWALENILFSEDAPRPYTNQTTYALSPNASCGLPQGSVCSSSAWSMVAGSILRPMAGDRRDISLYVDDVLAGARSRPELEQLHRQMEEELLRRSCGRLRLGRVRIVDLRKEPLDFLGHLISLTPEHQLRVRPSSSAWSKADRRCEELLDERSDQSPAPDAGELLEIAERYFKRWAASRGEWQPADAGIKKRMAQQRTSDVWHQYCWDNHVPMPDIV